MKRVAIFQILLRIINTEKKSQKITQNWARNSELTPQLIGNYQHWLTSALPIIDVKKN